MSNPSETTFEMSQHDTCSYRVTRMGDPVAARMTSEQSAAVMSFTYIPNLFIEIVDPVWMQTGIARGTVTLATASRSVDVRIAQDGTISVWNDRDSLMQTAASTRVVQPDTVEICTPVEPDTGRHHHRSEGGF